MVGFQQLDRLGRNKS